MTSNHTIGIFILLAVLASPSGFSQEEGPVMDVNEALLLLQSGREQIIRDEMRFSSGESSAFWPVYDQYQIELVPIRDRYSALLNDYLEKYRNGAVSEDFANKLIEDYLQIQGDILKVKEKHLKAFRKVLPARKAARFYQLENKLEAELNLQLALVIPLIDPV